MSGLVIKEDLFVKHNIVDSLSPEGRKIHDFLLARAKRLAGEVIDFEKTPVTFVMSDTEKPNAFFMQSRDQVEEPERDRYKNIKYAPNPLDTNIICVTKGLIDMVDNLDQLDYVLGHELTHMIFRGYGIKSNSKGEEQLADLHAVDLVYDAGSDPKEALKMQVKFETYAHEQREKEKKIRRYSREEDDKTAINWSEILDVHTTNSNRESALKASLTRISHLIDDRTPSSFDKGVFVSDYDDAVESFLKENDYQNQKSLGQLKILIDCIDHISTLISPEEYFETRLESLGDESHGRDSYYVAREREALNEYAKDGHKNYFRGKTLPKKYQQKLVALAESVARRVLEERHDNPAGKRPAALDTSDLQVYLKNKAYQYVQENGYPHVGDLNYSDSSGILYTFFDAFLGDNIRHKRGREDEPSTPRVVPHVEADILKAKAGVHKAKTLEELKSAYDEFQALVKIYDDLTNEKYGENNYGEKFDNLSFYQFHNSRTPYELLSLYPNLRNEKKPAWENLLEIAQTSGAEQEYAVELLAEEDIEDFRITHEQPYIREHRYTAYVIDHEGALKEVPGYELDNAVNRGLVLDAYRHIQDYFDNEDNLFDEARAKILALTEQSFLSFSETKDEFNNETQGHQAINEFTLLYNSLPEISKRKSGYKDTGIQSLMSERYLIDHPIPGTKKKEQGGDDSNKVVELDGELLDTQNPVFVQSFGKDFRQKVMADKETQAQKMFDVLLKEIQIIANIWDQLNEQKKAVSAEQEALYEQRGKVSDKSDEYKEIEAKMRVLYTKGDRLEQGIDTVSNGLHNHLFSIFSDSQHWFNIQRLTATQKQVIADMVVKDENGIFRRFLGEDRYTGFCNFKKILTHQVEHIVAGNEGMTEEMKSVANNLGYQPLSPSGGIDSFVVGSQGSRHGISSYLWYLHAMDTMRHLKESPEIDVTMLATSLINISVPEADSYSRSGEERAIDHDTYKKFVIETECIPLVAKAIGFTQNYNDLSHEELVEVADNLINLRRNMNGLLKEKKSSEDRWIFGGDEYSLKPEHQKFIDLIDKNIRGSIRRAQYKILREDNALKKMKSLYYLYHPATDNSSGLNRGSFITDIEKKEKQLRGLSGLAAQSDFWPDDALDHMRSFVFAKNTFLDDIEFEDTILNQILDKVEALPSGKKKNQCLFVLLDKNLRAPHPETRERLFDLYSNDVLAKMGKDDGSDRYQKRLSMYLKSLGDNTKKEWDIGEKYGRRKNLLANSMSIADKYTLIRRLSDKVLSQERSSAMIKKSCQVNLNSKNLTASYFYGAGVDYLTSEMDRNSETAEKFVEFLNSKGEGQECNEMSAYIEKTVREKYKDRDMKHHLDKVLKQTQPINCKMLYDNFWSAPLEARAFMTARILKSAVQNDSNQAASSSWENVFDIVMNTIISPEDSSTESRYARDIMHSYIKSRSDYERELILSAMMVANRNIGGDAGNVGKALKLFLENMGPAEIKLGQAISSHPNTPESIKKELQGLKNSADMPARWSIYDWIKAESIPEELWKDQYLGEVLGSASYYTTIALGDDKVLRLLRPEAREKATKGFKVIGHTVNDLKEKDDDAGLDYKELTSSVSEMVTQASGMSGIETDHEVGELQYRDAKIIYNGVTISSDGVSFPLKVMDWTARGKNWIVMDRAKGPVFNDLPEGTIEQVHYKKAFAKAYIGFEVTNILSGRKFDHDKHGAQLCINPENNQTGIFDTGAMAVRNPATEEQELLGHVLYGLMKAGVQGEKTLPQFSSILDKKIEELHEKGLGAQYLVEIKKGLLALGDFFKILDLSEIRDLLFDLDLLAQISEHTKNGLTQEMSLKERLQFKLFLETKGRNKDSDLGGNEEVPSTATDVRHFEAVTRSAKKSDWLSHHFPSGESAENRSPNNDFGAFHGLAMHRHASYS